MAAQALNNEWSTRYSDGPPSLDLAPDYLFDGADDFARLWPPLLLPHITVAVLMCEPVKCASSLLALSLQLVACSV